MTTFTIADWQGHDFVILDREQYMIMFDAGHGDAHGCFIGTYEAERSTPSHLVFRGEAISDVLIIHPKAIADITLNVFERAA